MVAKVIKFLDPIILYGIGFKILAMKGEANLKIQFMHCLQGMENLLSLYVIYYFKYFLIRS